MPWTTAYLPDGAYVRFSGTVTGEELVRANTEFYQHGYRAGLRFVVFDFSEGDHFDIYATAIERVAAQDIVAAAAAVPHLVVAVIAPHALAYGMSRMWEMQIAETGWRTLVARSRPDAFAWLEQQGIATDRFSAPHPGAATPP